MIEDSESQQHWFEKNRSRFSGLLSFGELLSKHTYFRIGGPAQVFAVPRCEEDLHWLAQGIFQTGMRYLFIGAGSNLLVSDRGFSGVVIRASRLNLELEALFGDSHSLRIRTGCSLSISSLLNKAAREGWAGIEFLTGIPGSIGGAVWMNAGTHLGETKDRVKKVETFSFDKNGEVIKHSFEGSALIYEYRENHFIPANHLVWAAEWEVNRSSPTKIKTLITETLARRKATQPLEAPSCGSVFKNPKNTEYSAWQVIDRLGLRGHRIGGAQFSEKHSNFILNLGAATARDAKSLVDLAKTRAEKELGITLQEEVIYLE